MTGRAEQDVNLYYLSAVNCSDPNVHGNSSINAV